MRVVDIMIASPNCCIPSTSARLAAGIMKQCEVGMLPVVDDYRTHRLLGVVTDRDLCTRALATHEDPEQILVEQCMTRDPVTCTPQMTVQQALASMATRRVHRLPVIDRDGRLCGMLSIDDLIRHEAVPPNHICMALRRLGESSVRVHKAASVGR